MLRIYGASDDLIEIEGDITEEFSFYDNGYSDTVLAFSDGTVVRVTYDHDGIWRFVPLASGTASLIHTFGIDDREHSDVVELIDAEADQIEWVVLGSHIEKRRR